jgi:outer membrane protein OmpA-like peptidoglycan-associated protein
MKKITFAACLMFIGMNSFAQTTYEKSKLTDNVSVGVTAGISSPLDFNSVTPFNTNFGIKIQKNFTPTFGLQAEGLAYVNDNHFSDLSTWIKAINVNVNGVINWSNAFGGYKHRFFEISSVTGLGWLHKYNVTNYLSAKTGLDLSFNLGDAHSIVLTPAVYWNLSEGDKIQFNRHYAQLALNLGYVYHFKNSNGTRGFKKYDVAALNDEINSLKKDLAEKPKEIVKEVTVTDTIQSMIDNAYTVSFSKGSSKVWDVDDIAESLKKTTGRIIVIGGVSPEGSEQYNQALAIKRANAVKKALVKAGISEDRIIVPTDYTEQRRATIVVEK